MTPDPEFEREFKQEIRREAERYRLAAAKRLPLEYIRTLYSAADLDAFIALRDSAP